MAFNTLVHQSTRLRLFAHLYEWETSFAELIEALGITEGNLSSHTQKMADAGCLRIEKQFVDRTPQAMYQLTERGQEQFEAHGRTFESLIEDHDT